MRQAARPRNTCAHTRRVADVMTRGPVAVGEDAPLDEVVALMERRGIKRVLVVTDGRLTGLVSRSDLLRALLTQLEAEAPACSDEEIRERLLRSLEGESWAPRASLRVHCAGGVIALEGVIYDEREREALLVAAQGIPGVKHVEDQLTWLDPVSGTVVTPVQAT